MEIEVDKRETLTTGPFHADDGRHAVISGQAYQQACNDFECWTATSAESAE